MRKIVAAAALSSALVFSGAAYSQGDPGKVAISISCGSVGIEFKVCSTGVEAWAKATGHRVQLVSTPNDSNERLALYQQLLAAKSGDIDVFQIDVVWPGILANHLIDLREFVDPGVLDQHFDAIVKNDIVDDRLVAMPWFTDAGLFYYRKDLLEKYGRPLPTTWQEMTETARIIQEGERAAGNDRMWGYVFQGRAFEGLTVNALEWLDSFNAGTIVNGQGEITVNNPRAADALTLAASWVNDIAPQGVINYSEEEGRGVFQSGNAVFMRNWPYAWPLLNAEDSPVRGKVAVAQLPKGGPDGKHTATLGGWQLAVSKYSQHPEVAADLVRYLTSREEQKRRAVVGGFNPTIDALYKDQEVLAANPFFGDLYEVFVNAVARPSRVTGVRYNQVSAEFWNAVHATLSGQTDAKTSLADLERTLDRVSRGGRW
ncbi:ABC transporter substrate-binding protein [Skermanella mucosa]|uniref:ABC transporter substrate-binding protein n=1 Tax=Skermanella mucosa TaxID=1789672 RepID=UPI00192BC71E|nr:ABC transporter substrate-binding protein [Skermanella mucosa]UEM19250.1 ABC transporter substrate-binding protein [Skermanella mucosa]